MKNYRMISIISWLFLPLFIDYERITRKSKGLKGYLKSVCFYHEVFTNTIIHFGYKKGLYLYINDMISNIKIKSKNRI